MPAGAWVVEMWNDFFLHLQFVCARSYSGWLAGWDYSTAWMSLKRRVPTALAETTLHPVIDCCLTIVLMTGVSDFRFWLNYWSRRRSERRSVRWRRSWRQLWCVEATHATAFGGLRPSGRGAKQREKDRGTVWKRSLIGLQFLFWSTHCRLFPHSLGRWFSRHSRLCCLFMDLQFLISLNFCRTTTHWDKSLRGELKSCSRWKSDLIDLDVLLLGDIERQWPEYARVVIAKFTQIWCT